MGGFVQWIRDIFLSKGAAVEIVAIISLAFVSSLGIRHGVGDAQQVVTWFDKQPKIAMQILVSAGVFVMAGFVILSHSYDPKDKNWAYGAMGTVLGYWLNQRAES